MRLPPGIEKLRRDHRVDSFDCGSPELDRFLVQFAFGAQRAGGSATYVALEESQVVGYYSLVVGSISHADASERLAKGLARHPIPLMVIARLAVDRRRQGQGIAAALLKDATMRTLAAADIAGIRALAVHAKDDHAAAFYAHFGFIHSPTDPLHLFVLLKDVERMLRA